MYTPLAFLTGKISSIWYTPLLHHYHHHHHHPPPPKKFVLKDQNAEDDTNFSIGPKQSQSTTIQSKVSKTDKQIWSKSVPRGEKIKRRGWY